MIVISYQGSDFFILMNWGIINLQSSLIIGENADHLRIWGMGGLKDIKDEKDLKAPGSQRAVVD